MTPDAPTPDGPPPGVPEHAPPGVPEHDALLARAPQENFPVALRFLARRERDDLMAIYGFARLADEFGDAYPGDRLGALDWLEGDLRAAVRGRATHPAVARLTPTIARHDLDLAPFLALVEANRRDQHQTRYESFDDLLDYCRLSANPVGRLVLAVFGVSDPEAIRLSDDVCSALQVVEHLQDVREDLDRGRIYLPAADLAEFGCTEGDLAEPVAPTALRALVAFECDRAASLLESGRPLVTSLRGQARPAVAGFVAGGLAVLDAIEAAGFDVLGRRCRPSRRRVVRHAASLLAARRRSQPGRRRP